MLTLGAPGCSCPLSCFQLGLLLCEASHTQSHQGIILASPSLAVFSLMLSPSVLPLHIPPVNKVRLILYPNPS